MAKFEVQVTDTQVIVIDHVSGEKWETSHEYVADIMQVLFDRVDFAIDDYKPSQE
jgi:DNA relaxase NicK